jgi:hypothetical protein
MIKQLKLCVILVLLFSCKDDPYTYKSIQIDKELRAEGLISKDTAFNGLIKFYNVPTGHIVKQCYYKDDTLTGQQVVFFNNGKIANIQNFDNGRRNGLFKYYDSTGNLVKEENYYFDLREGSVIKYKENKPDEYIFLSLDEKPLLSFSYDHLLNKKITEEISQFFFFSYNDFIDMGVDSVKSKRDYLLYTPHPPKYNFQYSLVNIDSAYQIKEELKRFNQDVNWVRFELLHQKLQEKTFALRLEIKDPVAGGIIMYKILK